MPGGHTFCFTVLLVCQFSTVLCNNQYFEYFYNKYHKERSTTIRTSSASTDHTPGTRPTHFSDPFEAVIFSEQSNPSTVNYVDDSENLSQNENQITRKLNNDNEIILQHGYPEDRVKVRIAKTFIGIGAGLVVLTFIVVCSILVCCPTCTRREQKGFVVGSTIPDPVDQTEHNRLVVQQNLPEAQQLPPPYDTLPVQQQYQYSAMQEQKPQYSPVQQEFQHPLTQQQFQQPPMNTEAYNLPSAPPNYEKY